MRCIIATRSAGKLRELVPMLAAHGIAGIGLDAAGVPVSEAEDTIEVFDTFEANALAKARYFARLTGLPCVADDSGLCVDALDGAPGVRSRRFAQDLGRVRGDGVSDDALNAEAVLDACWDSGRAPPWRARFTCAAAFVGETLEFVACGDVQGALVPEREGDGGFGYDPWFLSTELGVTFARASLEAKAVVSHRARAVTALLGQLRGAAPADVAG